MLVPLPPKSSSATTPSCGSPGFVFSAFNDVNASLTNRAGHRNASFSARTVVMPQYAGTAIASSCDGWPPLAWSSASSASTSSWSALCDDPSAATNGTASPTRSTKPLMVKPDAGRINTERRITG